MDYGWVAEGQEVDVEVDGVWQAVGGCGMLKREMLTEAGYDPEEVRGYAYGVGLERLAQLKLGIESIHDLWRPPFVQLQP